MNSTSVLIAMFGTPFASRNANVALAADLLYSVVLDRCGRSRKTGTVLPGINASAAVESIPPENARPGFPSDVEVYGFPDVDKNSGR